VREGVENPNFPVELDTTSSISWVASNSCKNCESKNRYHASNSTTAVQTNKTIELSNEDGDVKGLEVFENIKLGKQVLSVNSYGFVQVTKMD